MIAIYGDLHFEDLVAQSRQFELQAVLFQRKIIQGVQLRVAHPSFTPEVKSDDLPTILKRLPIGCSVFVHFGAENLGVDFGQCFDEVGVFEKQKSERGTRWEDWNRETVEWGLSVQSAASISGGLFLGVAHPGYGQTINDVVAFGRAVRRLQDLGVRDRIAIENVPPIVDRAWYEAIEGKRVKWDRDHYWGFGGTPEDMSRFLKALGDSWRCLIDFTHLQVTVNQAIALEREPALRACKILGHTLEEYLALPHSKVCHFSGTPSTLMDSHDYPLNPLSPPIREGLRQMEAVCLEIDWGRVEVVQIVEGFCEELAQ